MIGSVLGGNRMIGGGLGDTGMPQVPFTPADLANLELWLAADAITGLSDGDPVATWADQSTHGRDATQATGSAKPTFKTNTQNGLPVLRFDGIDDFLALAFTLAQPLEVYMVLKLGGSGIQFLFDIRDSGGDFFVVTHGDDGPFLSLACTSFLDGSHDISSAWHSISCLGDGSSSKIYLDAAPEASGNAGTQGLDAHDGAIGARHDGATFFTTMDLGEVIVLSSPSSTDRSKLQAYLKAKWATP